MALFLVVLFAIVALGKSDVASYIPLVDKIELPLLARLDMSVINESIISAIEKAVTTAKDDLEKELREVIKEAIQKGNFTRRGLHIIFRRLSN